MGSCVPGNGIFLWYIIIYCIAVLQILFLAVVESSAIICINDQSKDEALRLKERTTTDNLCTESY